MHPAQHRYSIHRGATFSTLVCPLLLAVLTLTFSTRAPSIAAIAGAVGFVLCMSLPVTVTASFTLLLPVALFLRSVQALSWLGICVAGTLIGAFANTLSAALLGAHSPWTSISLYAYGAIFGLISGFGFCVGAGLNHLLMPPRK